MENNNTIILFENVPIRKTWHNDEWFYVINDVIAILADSKDPKQYFNKLRKRDPELERGVQIVHPLRVETDKGFQKMNCANAAGIFRIIQSIPSSKAEPFKRWLAEVGQQTLSETEDPELGFERLTELYKAKGYDDKWIENRLKSIETRKNLTNEWKKRGITEGGDYSKLTAAIAQGTFGVSPSEHSQLKGLNKENLRDHMTPMELIFTALGEEVTRTLAIKNDAQGFHQNHETATEAGQIAGEARERVEVRTGEKVVSSQNYLKNLEEATKED